MIADIKKRNYWLRVFGAYAAVEACIQLLFWFVLNRFGASPISILEFHLVMWFFQSVLIWPIWLVAWSVIKYPIPVQILVNIAFFVIYSFFWFGPVQDCIAFCFEILQQFTRVPQNRIAPHVDNSNEFQILNYQLLKHGFRLGWFFVALYFYQYQTAEKKRMSLAIANKELQIELFKWRLNPDFYFKTIDYLKCLAIQKPQLAAVPILKLSGIMEYVIYEAKKKTTWLIREIKFLSNYVELLNDQHGKKIITLEVIGEPGKQQIAPLTLTGLVDKVYQVTEKGEELLIRLNLEKGQLSACFSGRFISSLNLLFDADASVALNSPTNISVKMKLYAKAVL